MPRLLGWVQKVNSAKIKQIVESMDWDKFDSVIDDKWRTPPRELRLFLSGLTTNDDGEPIRSWLERSCRIASRRLIHFWQESLPTQQFVSFGVWKCSRSQRLTIVRIGICRLGHWLELRP